MAEVDLYGTRSAEVWAKEFIRVVEENNLPVDEGLMIGWFANAIESGIESLTAVQAINHAVGRAIARRILHGGEGAREFSTAITKLEEAQMWFTRGMALATGKFNPADLEQSDG